MNTSCLLFIERNAVLEAVSKHLWHRCWTKTHTRHQHHFSTKRKLSLFWISLNRNALGIDWENSGIIAERGAREIGLKRYLKGMVVKIFEATKAKLFFEKIIFFRLFYQNYGDLFWRTSCFMAFEWVFSATPITKVILRPKTMNDDDDNGKLLQCGKLTSVDKEKDHRKNF